MNHIKKILTYALSSFFIFLITTINTGCKKDTSNSSSPPPGPATNEVWMQNTAFSPATITVAANTTVRWVNKDSFAHTVTSDAALFDSGTINSNGTYTHQFTSAGTYPYHCSVHTGMTGKVIVQ